VGGGADVAYDTAGLRTAAGGLQDVSGSTDAAGSALQAAALDAVMFGRTPAAPVFAAAVQAARDAQARGFRQEAQRSGDVAGRGTATAGLGDDLTGETTSVAGSVPVSR
jgi:hypothetical protein